MPRKIILFLIILFSAPLCYAEKETFPFIAGISEDSVSVRAGQSINFERISVLNKGEEVLVVDRQYSWYKIKLPLSARSFVSEKYVVMKDDRQGEIVGDRVNVRAGAGIHYAILGQLTVGSAVTVVEKLDGWYRVQPIEESFGWISKEFAVFKSENVSAYLATLQDNVGEEGQGTGESDEKIGMEEQIIEPVITERQIEIMNPVSELVSVAGVLESANEPALDSVSYKIISEGQPPYYLKGLNPALDRFLNCKVILEGNQEKSSSGAYLYPLVTVTKIQLIL